MIIKSINDHHMNYRGFFSHQIGLKRAPQFRLGKYIVLASPECLYFDFSVNKLRSPTKVDVTEYPGNNLKRFSNCSPQDYFAWKRNFWNIFILVAVLINVRWHWLINALSLSTAIRWLAERHESPVSFPPLIFDTGQHLFSDLSCKSKGLLGRFVYCWHWCLYWPGIKMLKWMGHTP